jgi:hypothetical protein
MTAVTCPACGEEAVVRRIQASHAANLLTVTLEPVTVTACPRGHMAVRPAATDVSSRVREQMTVARRRRLGRADRCGECEADLVMPARDTQTPVPVVIDDEVVTVLLECPMVRCAECGREQVPSQVDALLEDVVTAALAGAPG